ncbi:hypothetical protein [Enterococcus faecalis]|uniref:hypothetical protein n=1 Tax=Enterococcus faecalis TaxID=1351 RepID=UPI001A974165|nr:hypothetical protein [Enterococcus faecalis]MBO1137176.1 hypothetical protein [Enterococcus faecalis]
MRLFKKKTKFVYEISGCSHFRMKDITDPYDLIKHVIDEDNRFRREFLEGTILISKVKNDLQGTIYFSKKIQLPQEEGFDWFEELSSFFTRKPLTYEDECIEETAVSSEKAKEDNEQLFTLEDFEAEMNEEREIVEERIPVTNTIENQESKEEASLPLMPKKEAEITKEDEWLRISKREFEALKQTMEQQQIKMEKLSEEIEQKNSLLKMQENKVVSVSESVLDQITPKVLATKNDEMLEAILRSTKKEMTQTLSQYIEAETTKINEEIQRLDKREKIEEEVTQRLLLKKNEQLERLTQQLVSEKEQQIKEEERRHQEHLMRIDQQFEQKLSEQTKDIENAYQAKLTESIQEEYENQTQQLSRILQGKMDELQLRQQTMNAGLKANFQEALERFNQEHNQVIQAVDKKRKQPPIDFAERRRLKEG